MSNMKSPSWSDSPRSGGKSAAAPKGPPLGMQLTQSMVLSPRMQTSVARPNYTALRALKNTTSQ